MPNVKCKVGNYSAYMLMSEISNIWSTYNIDNLSEKTRNSYWKFLSDLEKDVGLPTIDCINDYEIYIVGKNNE